MKKLNNEEFIERIIEIHGNKYDISKVVYLNVRTKISLICPNHGEFKIAPDNLLRQKQGCVKCAQENHKLTKISEEKIASFKSLHNNKYSYNDLSVTYGYINITCPNHGEFKQLIYGNENGHGCYDCEKESRVKIRLKTCKSCNTEKLKSEFNNHYQMCKECHIKNINITSKYCENCKTDKPIGEFYFIKESKDKLTKTCKECYNTLKKPANKLYKQKNKNILREKNKIYHKDRLKTDVLYRLKCTTKAIIRKSLSKKGYAKKSRTHEILGCSYIEFKAHIESLFLPDMNWDNRDRWHIDHITPLAFAETEQETLMVNHFSNLRPLWIDDNQLKSDSIEIKNNIYYEILEMRNYS